MEQLVARWAHNPKATGSNPVRASFIFTQLFISTLGVKFILPIHKDPAQQGLEPSFYPEWK